jgi:hypothetical protein
MLSSSFFQRLQPAGLGGFAFHIVALAEAKCDHADALAA